MIRRHVMCMKWRDYIVEVTVELLIEMNIAMCSA